MGIGNRRRTRAPPALRHGLQTAQVLWQVPRPDRLRRWYGWPGPSLPRLARHRPTARL